MNKKSTWILGLLLAASVGYAAGTSLSAGKYTSTLSPSVDEQAADKIEKNLNSIKEIRFIDVKPKDSSLHFSVKDNQVIDLAKITDAVQAAVPGTTVSAPVEDTMPMSDQTNTSPRSPQSY